MRWNYCLTSKCTEQVQVECSARNRPSTSHPHSVQLTHRMRKMSRKERQCQVSRTGIRQCLGQHRAAALTPPQQLQVHAQDQHKIKPIGVLPRVGGASWALTPNWRAMARWWLLIERDCVYFEGVALWRSITLQWIALNQRVKMDIPNWSQWIIFKWACI